MCTLTVVPTADGYIVAMNRDERLTRPQAFAPRVFEYDSAAAIFPYESSGGTWIACNSHGSLLALLNWHDVVPEVIPEKPQTRGLVIPGLIGQSDSIETCARFESLDLCATFPFRLVGVFVREQIIVEWRWNGVRRQKFEFAWQKKHWFSSSVSDCFVKRERGRTCASAAERLLEAPLNAIRSLHRSHDPTPGPFSMCVHRKDAATASYTEIRCEPLVISMGYVDGSPCQKNTFDSQTALALSSVPAVQRTRQLQSSI
jgi:hypothetical protein